MSLKDDITVLPSSTQDELNKGSTCEECAEALSDYIIKLEADNALLKDKVKELEASRKRAFWYAFEQAAMSPENRNINENWCNFVEWELGRYPSTTIDGKG